MSDLTHAAAFLLGAVFATIVTLRLLRVSIELLRRERRRNDED